MYDNPVVLPWRVHSETSVKDPVFEGRPMSEFTSSSRGTGHFQLGCPNWVKVIALSPVEHVVLLRQFRHGSGEITIEIPGGMVDEGEAYVAAGLRELVEETGYVGESPELIGEVAPNPAIQNNRCGTLLIKNCRPTSQMSLESTKKLRCF